MCKCEIHENFLLKIKSLGINYNEQFWPSILCDDSLDLTSPCWRDICVNCQLKNKFTIEKSDADTVFWKEWIKTETGHLRRDQKQECVDELKDLFSEFSFFKEHVRIKQIQFTAFTEDKKRSHCHVLQCSFTMAYNCDYQNEVQSALWFWKCINLFTAALYSKSQVCQPFLIITDSQDKGKNSVFTFINALTNYIQFEKGDMLIIYTDGPSSEFKNRYIVKLVSILSKKFQCKVSWKYFATWHGKGVVDGIGGSAKSLVRKRVMNQSKNAVIVQNSADFYKVAKDDMKWVTVLHISEGQISELIKEKKPWENIKDSSGISKMHVISCCDGLTIEMFKTNLSKDPSSIIEDEDVDRSKKLM